MGHGDIVDHVGRGALEENGHLVRRAAPRGGDRLASPKQIAERVPCFEGKVRSGPGILGVLLLVAPVRAWRGAGARRASGRSQTQAPGTAPPSRRARESRGVHWGERRERCRWWPHLRPWRRHESPSGMLMDRDECLQI